MMELINKQLLWEKKSHMETALGEASVCLCLVVVYVKMAYLQASAIWRSPLQLIFNSSIFKVTLKHPSKL